MSEAELVAAFATLGQAFLAGLQAAFAIVSAYLVALYFFLGRAPRLLKGVAFGFFTATLAVLALYMAGAKTYGDGIAVSLASSRVQSPLGSAVVWMINSERAYLLLYASLSIGVATYVMLFYLTFLYRWQQQP